MQSKLNVSAKKWNERRKKRTNWIFEWFWICVSNQWELSAKAHCTVPNTEHADLEWENRTCITTRMESHIYVCLSTVYSVLSVFQQQSACHKHIIISCLHEMLLWLMIYSFLWIYLNSPSNCAKPCTMCSRMHMNSAVFGNSQNSLDNWLASAGQWLMNWNFNQNDLWAPLRTGQHNLY